MGWSSGWSARSDLECPLDDSTNTIDPVAVGADHGQHILVTGPIACTAGERAQLRVTVTQRATGAIAEGRPRGLAGCCRASCGDKDVFQARRVQPPLHPLLQLLPTGLCQALGRPAREGAKAPRQEVREQERFTLLKAFL
jgi:hypothetical protein